ncbi:DUF551 domain-containing protein [Atlantibacter hermannii]|uniref:DUF551 domain-containing protein n=1 Tax=Atlantibacter hermannii TaxID=565 RepID=UPI003326C123
MTTAFTKDQLIEHAKRRLNYSRCGCRISDSDRALDEALIETAIATLECLAATAAPAVQAEQLSGNTEHVSQTYTLPADYLQGHKDGCEWAARMAEANHPQTGDWLFDDPIELAKAIRKGPDMLPAEPGNSPAIPDDWIPVSERMPGSRHAVLVGRWFGREWTSKWATHVPGHPDAQDSGWLIPGASWTPTHWHELPAVPKQEAE